MGGFATMAAPVCLLLAGAAAGPASPAAAAGEEEAAIRRDLSLLVDAAGGVRDDWDAPSPTALARGLLERKEKAVQAALKEGWDAAGVKGSTAAEHELEIGRVARFLYGLDGPASPDTKTAPDKVGFGGTLGAVYELQGVVLARPGGTGARPKVMGEKGWDKEDRPGPRLKFEALVGGGKWRRPPKPDARKALKLWDDPGTAKWTGEEKRCLALAAGEACGADPSVLPKLLQRFEEDPNDELTGLAMAWAGAPNAVAALRARIAPLAGRVAEGKEAALPLLQRACRGVRRASPEALVEEIGKLAGEAREAAMLGAGFRAAAGILAAEYEKAADPAGRDAAFLTMVRLIRKASFFREMPSPADMPRVVAIFRAMIESGTAEEKGWAEEGSCGLFYMGFRDGKAGIHMSQNGVSVDGDGERCGPYPGMAPILRSLDEDMKAGNLAFSEDGTGLFDRVAAPLAQDGPALTGLKDPKPFGAEAKKDAPVRMKAEPAAGGLKVTITNAGPQPFAVNPVALHYLTAEYVPVTVGSGSAGARTFTQLTLELGSLGGWSRWTVPSKVLVTVKPGGSWSFEVPLRPDHEKADHVGIEIRDVMRIPEGSPVAVLRSVGSSWVR
jgi:hypothetical protein